MARIQTPQHVQELQAEFKVRDQFGLELLETIQPTYSLGIQKVASVGYPRKCFGIIEAGAGGVGTNIECALSCPTDIGIIILLETISVENLGGVVNARADDGGALATISAVGTSKHFRDTRINPVQRPDGVLNTLNPLTAAPNGTNVGAYSCLADDTLIIPVDVVLGGGGYFLLRNPTANAGLGVTFNWTEFLLEDR